MKKNKLERVMQILTTLQSGKGCAVDDLANTYGLTRRTVFRDLQELRKLGVPYQYDIKTAAYTIKPEFFLPPIDLRFHEALCLLLLIDKASKQIQLPYKLAALQAGAKIAQNLPADIRHTCNKALRNISTRSGAQVPVNQLDQIFEQLQTTIDQKRVVNLRYHSLFEDKIINLRLHPFHLWYNRRAWYVLGFSSMHNSVRTFKLNRIKQLKISSKRFKTDRKFDLYEYIGKAWSMIPEGRIYNIKLRFLPKVAENVTEVRWHSTQKVVRNSDGSAAVEFRVDGLGEITWWILGYGDQVQVLAPKQLRKHITEVAKNMVRINEQK